MPRTLTPVVLAFTLLASSCASAEPVRADLDSDPASTGLVVAECRMENRSTFGNQRLRLDGGSIQRLESGVRWYAEQREGLLIFDGLPPGTYYVDYVQAQPGIAEERAVGVTGSEPGTRSYKLPHTPGFEFTVEAGEPKFVGPMTAKNGRRRGDVWVDVHEEPTAENRAWRKLLAYFPNSPWAPVVEARLDELTGGD